MEKLHVSAYIGHHQVFSTDLRGSQYISEWEILIKRSLVSNPCFLLSGAGKLCTI